MPTARSDQSPGGPGASVAKNEPNSSAGVGPVELIIMISSIMALVALGIDLLLPGFDEIRSAYNLGDGSNEVGQIISVYLTGMAVSQLVYGPLADRFGRRPILWAGLFVYVLGSVGAALAPSMGVLLVSRFVWGAGAAGARVVATAMVRDCYSGEAMARVMSLVMAVFTLVPVVAPILGAQVIKVLPWQSLFWIPAIWTMLIGLGTTRLGETLDPAHVRDVNLRQIGRTYLEVARTRVTLLCTLASMFIAAAFTLYLATVELIVGEMYDRGSQLPWIFAGVSVCFGLTSLLNGALVERIGLETMIALASGLLILIAIGLVVFSISGGGHPSFWPFIVLVGLAMSMNMLLTPNLNTLSLIPVGHIAGAAAAFTSALRLGLGAQMAGIASARMGDSVTPFAVFVLAMALLSAATIAYMRLAKPRHSPAVT